MNIFFIVSVFFAGLLSFFSPCLLPLLPIYIGYFTPKDESSGNQVREKIVNTIAFVLGISTLFFILGFSSGTLSSLFSNSTFIVIAGIFVILMGLHQTGVINIAVLNKQKTAEVNFNPKRGIVGAYLLGFFFSFGWTPCIGPVLGSVLGLAAQNNNAIQGGLLLLVYSAGLCIPFVIISIGSQFLLTKIKAIYKYFDKIKIAGGVLIIIMGIYMIVNNISYNNQTSATSSNTNNASTQNESIQNESTQNESTENDTTQNEPTKDNSTDNMVKETTKNKSNNPNFALVDINGKTWDLTDLQGKNVYIKIWGSWCPSCLAGLDEFVSLYNEYENSPDTQIITIVSPNRNGEQSAEDFTEWANSLDLKFPMLLDNTGDVVKSFNVVGYPTNIFIDKDGSLYKTVIGDASNEEIIKIFEKMNMENASTETENINNEMMATNTQEKSNENKDENNTVTQEKETMTDEKIIPVSTTEEKAENTNMVEKAESNDMISASTIEKRPKIWIQQKKQKLKK